MAKMFTQFHKSTDSEGTIVISNEHGNQSSRQPTIGGNKFKFDITAINKSVFEEYIINLNQLRGHEAL